MEYGPRLAVGATAEVFAVDDGRVLKLFVDADRAGVEREARATRVADEAGLPVPTVHEVVTVAGRHGIVLSRHDGPTLLAHLRSRPWRVWHVTRTLARLHAQVHSHSASALPPLRERLRADVRDAPGLDRTERDRVLAHLRRLPTGDALCHGDFHPGNVMQGRDGPVVVDWHDARAGPPAADVARSLVLARFSFAPPSAREEPGRAALARTYRWAYRREYETAGTVDRDAVDRWLLPVAAARLTEGVSEESRLRRFVRWRLEREGRS